MLDKVLIQKILSGVATELDLENAPMTEVVAVKSCQSEMHTRFVASGVSVEKAVDDDSKRPVFKHIASDESKDSVGDRILVKGWDLERFKANPQLLWTHDQRILPLGTVERVWKGRVAGEPALLTESRFHEADENPQAPLVEKLVAKGAIPGVSVGFVPLKMIFPESEKDREKLGLGPWGVLHEKSELLELSVVPVPANANALRVKMFERAQPLLRLAKQEGMDEELIEAVERMLNITEESERALRRRMILVPDIKAAVAEVMGAPELEGPVGDPEPEPEPVPEPEPDSKGATVLMRLDPDSLKALEGLTEALTKSTPTGGTDAVSAESKGAPVVDPLVPADPGGDFLTRAVQHATEKLGSTESQT